MANVQLDSLTDTWNNGATTFNAVKMNVTDTASAAASKLIDLQVGGNTKANITKAGLLTLASGLTLTGANTIQTTTGALTIASGSSNIIITPTSNVGIGTTSPDRKLDVLDASNAQVRLTQADGSTYTDLQTLSTGHLSMTTSGGNRITSTTVNDTSITARQIQGGISFDGFTDARVLHTIGADIGTADFSVSVIFQVPTTTPSVSYGIFSIGTSASTFNVARSAYAGIDSAGKLVFYINGSTAAYYRAKEVSGFVSTYGGKIVTVTFTKSTTGNTATVTINGAEQTTSEITGGGGSAPSWTDTISSTYLFTGQTSSSFLYPAPIFWVSFLNRALATSDCIIIPNQGIQEADKSGSLAGQTSGTLTRGKRYRITTFVAGDSFTNVGAGSNATGVEFVATGTTPTTWTNASTLNRIGAILDADMSFGVGYQVPDRSSNKYHGVVSATGTAWTLAQRRGQLRVSSNTSGDQQLLGSQVCLPTNAIITSIVGYTTGTPTVKVGNASGGAQVVASVAMSASTYTQFTLAAVTTTTGNLWVNSSSSATINWTITYMIADP